jgi:hypothetical protein
MPHVKDRIIKFCQERYGNRLIRISCGITGSGAEPNFQAHLRDGNISAFKGRTMEQDFREEYDPKNTVEIWCALSAA